MRTVRRSFGNVVPTRADAIVRSYASQQREGWRTLSSEPSPMKRFRAGPVSLAIIVLS